MPRKWTKYEDDRLIDRAIYHHRPAVYPWQNGGVNWDRVSADMYERTPQACQRRLYRLMALERANDPGGIQQKEFPPTGGRSYERVEVVVDDPAELPDIDRLRAIVDRASDDLDGHSFEFHQRPTAFPAEGDHA